jgi:hypothetical protein
MNVSISVDMHLSGQTSAEGTFKAWGSINDGGTTTETFQIAADGKSVEGTKVLTGSGGNMVIRFEGSLMPEEGTSKVDVNGTWEVVSGTQAYSGIAGGGQVSTVIDLAVGTLHADYTGDILPAQRTKDGAARDDAEVLRRK